MTTDVSLVEDSQAAAAGSPGWVHVAVTWDATAPANPGPPGPRPGAPGAPGRVSTLLRAGPDGGSLPAACLYAVSARSIDPWGRRLVLGCDLLRVRIGSRGRARPLSACVSVCSPPLD